MVKQLKPGKVTNASIEAIKKYTKGVAAALAKARGPSIRERALWRRMGFDDLHSLPAAAAASASPPCLLLEDIMRRFNIPALELPPKAVRPGLSLENFLLAGGPGKTACKPGVSDSSAVPVGFVGGAGEVVNPDAPQVAVPVKKNKRTTAERRRDDACKKAKIAKQAQVLMAFVKKTG